MTPSLMAYDELGRRGQTRHRRRHLDENRFDAAGRITGETNALGSFAYGYDGSSTRLVAETCPNGQTETIGYGNNLVDFAFQQITNAVGRNSDLPIQLWSRYPQKPDYGLVTAGRSTITGPLQLCL